MDKLKSYMTISLPALLLPFMASPSASWAGSAEENYRLYCVQCHGTKGNGEGINNTAGGLSVSPRNHADPAEMAKLTDEEVRLSIAKGGDAVNKSELMPAWGDTLTEKEIGELVVYLRQLCKCEGKK
jgi:cytochrome c oxidase cbb3-type subunit III